MSGLEKFQANETWRAHIKKLRFAERKPIPAPPTHIHQSHRFSLDIAEDLQILLEEKKIPCNSSSKKIHGAGNMYEELMNDENKPMNNAEGEQHHNFQRKMSGFGPAPLNYCNDSICDDQDSPQWPRASNESFEALERMCNKTVSDPNSTLFKYWHSDNKEEIVADVKKRSEDGNFNMPLIDEARVNDAEDDALQRLLNELCVQEQTQLENISPVKGVELTQLEDTEAPSRLWENTMMGDSTMLQTSPVKMVGLLRPSTIIEEGCEEITVELEDDDLSSQLSFQSAVKGSEASASYYDTAHDSTSVSAAANLNDRPIQHNDINWEHAQQAIEVKEYSIHATTQKDDLEQSVDLINLDMTLQVPPVLIAHPNSGSERSEKEDSRDSVVDESESIIEILSDEEDVAIKQTSFEEAVYSSIEQVKLERPSMAIGVNSIDSRVDVAARIAAYEQEDKNISELEDSEEHSLHFNDTMEEVEYMMKKGMQYMAAANATVDNGRVPTTTISTQTAAPNSAAKKVLETKKHITLLSPKLNDRYRSPSPMLHRQRPVATISASKGKTVCASPKREVTPTTVTRPKPQKRFAVDIKPLPKLNVFKKPASAIPTSVNMRMKETSGKQFPHIISPIGTYMKKTATTPLMANFKQSGTQQDVHNATVFRELEYGSRVYKPMFESKPLALGSKIPSLPKKAYISSEFKHVVDERTPVTIPGGKNIQKYLEDAMLPTIVRHEGKLKMIDSENVGREKAAPKNRNASLANLSVMSGDISVYTMRDAQKF